MSHDELINMLTDANNASIELQLGWYPKACAALDHQGLQVTSCPWALGCEAPWKGFDDGPLQDVTNQAW